MKAADIYNGSNLNLLDSESNGDQNTSNDAPMVADESRDDEMPPVDSEPPPPQPPQPPQPPLPEDQSFGANINHILQAPQNANVIFVSTIAELDAAARNASAGDAIVVRNGTYPVSGTVTFSNSGTTTNPIYLIAESKDNVLFTGGREWHFSGANWVISGFRFENLDRRVRISGDNTRFSGNRFTDCEAGITVTASNIEIDHNIWTGTRTLSIIMGQASINCGNNCQFYKGSHLHHNTFRDIPKLRSNGGEAMMLGYGYEPLPSTYDDGLELLVEYNLFENARGDAEVVSVKSSMNTIRNNCFTNNGWGGLVIRMGNNNTVTGNQFLNLETTGVRISGRENLIQNNYFSGSANNRSSAVSLHNRARGAEDRFVPWGIYSYDAADNNTIIENKFYNFSQFVRDYPFIGPRIKYAENTNITNNDLFLTSSNLYHLQDNGRSAQDLENANNFNANNFLTRRPAQRSECLPILPAE